MSKTWIAVSLLLLSPAALAQVKSIEGGAGKLVTRHSAPTLAPTVATTGMTNQDVLDLAGLGLADDIIIQKIQTAASTNFDTSVASLKGLKAAKISDNVIRVMVNPKAVIPAAQPLTPSANSDLPKEIGVYVVLKSKLTEVEPEIVGWQTGGVLKSMATLGLDKGHINGKIMKSRSPLRTANPVEFIVRTPEGTSVTEYQLLSLYVKGNRREFRAMTGGIFHATGGAERTAIEFKSEKIGERTWRIQLQNLSPGEYGFLPPGISSASISSSGKMYTFGIRE